MLPSALMFEIQLSNTGIVVYKGIDHMHFSKVDPLQKVMMTQHFMDDAYVAHKLRTPRSPDLIPRNT